MIFKRSGSQNKRDQVAGKAVSQAQIGAPKSLKDTHKSSSDVQQTAVVPGGTRQDPLADDLIVRVLKAMEDWARANGLSSLPRHIVFEQALSILNAMDRSFPSHKTD